MTTSSQWLEQPQLTKTFSTATLFVEPPAVRKGLPAFAVSLLLHGVVLFIALIAFHPSHGGSVHTRFPNYTVRMIELQPPQLRPHLAPPRPASGGMSVHTAAAARSATGSAARVKRFELPISAKLSKAKQTLIQLDAPPKLAMNQVVVPDLVLWTQQDVPPPRKRLIPPPPRNVPKPAPNLQAPTLDLPNQEIKIADMRFSPPPANVLPKLAVPPATTAPIKVNGAEEAGQIPQTVSTTSTNATAAHIISLSSVPLRAEGLIALPAANQIAASGGQEDNGSGQTTGAVAAGEVGKTGAAMAGTREAGAGGRVNGTLSGDVGSAAQGPTGTGSAGGAGSRAAGVGGDAPLPVTVHKLVLPKDGKFGVVVLGSTAAEAYPDSAGLMTGKVIYTVYLKVGLRKSWILQYCLPGAVEQRFRAGGSATPLDAPWPFVMLRPDLAIGPSIDALMIRGMVNAEGHFEQLTLAMPSQFPQKELLLSSLRKWEFRPAKRDQQPVAVEVLLIIPGEGE